jgi:hypothetical protein
MIRGSTSILTRGPILTYLQAHLHRRIRCQNHLERGGAKAQKAINRIRQIPSCANLDIKGTAMNIVRYLGICVLLSACSTVTYPGPRRPSDQVATIRTRGTDIIEIDGTRWPATRGEFEILPGSHSLLVHLNASTPNGPYSVIYFHSKYPQRVCFTARPGRSYLVSFNDRGNGSWDPRIFDEATLFWVTTRQPKAGQRDCRAP